MASTEGGVEIEKLAATDPDKIVTVRVDIAEGLGGYHVNNLTYGMGRVRGPRQAGRRGRARLVQDLPRL